MKAAKFLLAFLSTFILSNCAVAAAKNATVKYSKSEDSGVFQNFKNDFCAEMAADGIISSADECEDASSYPDLLKIITNRLNECLHKNLSIGGSATNLNGMCMSLAEEGRMMMKVYFRGAKLGSCGGSDSPGIAL